LPKEKKNERKEGERDGKRRKKERVIEGGNYLEIHLLDAEEGGKRDTNKVEKLKEKKSRGGGAESI